MADGWPLVGREEELQRVAHALATPTTWCVLISGDAGVGKTRLAREAAARAADNGSTVRWAIAGEETRSIALGAIAHLLASRLPDVSPIERFELLGWARRGLVDGRPARDLLVIDDAHLLDDMTAALVRQLVTTRTRPHLLLTARTAEMPRWLLDLARDDNVESIRIQVLSERDVSALVDAALDGPVDPAIRTMLWEHSSGNALWLRQLIRDGIDGGALNQRQGVWVWDGPIASGNLTQVLAARLEDLPENESRTLELIALGEPIPLRVIRRLDVESALAELERRDLIEVDATERIRTAHPLYGSLLRARATPIVARAVRSRVADAFAAGGGPDGADVVRVARWRLDAGDTADSDLMLAASRRALLLDAVLAERFARAAREANSGFTARHALAVSLFEQRRFAESMQVLRALLAGELSDQERVMATLEAALMRAWTQFDAPGAMAQLRKLERDFPLFAPNSASVRAAIALFSGATIEAVRAALPLVDDPAVEPGILRLAALAAIPALAMTGRVGEAIALADRAKNTPAEPRDDTVPIRDGPTYAAAQLEWEHVLALRWAARITDAVTTAKNALRRAAGEPDHHAQSYGLLNAAAGGAWLAAGDLRSAVGALQVAAAALRRSDVNGTVVSCLADLARAEAVSGNLPAAERALSEATRWRTPAVHMFDAALGQARAVVAAFGGELTRARTEAAAAAELARQWEQPVVEGVCLHLLVRFGGASEAAPRLAELAASTDAALVGIFADHARAAAVNDAPRLEEAAERFRAAGSPLLAANVSAQAARAHRTAGRADAANRAAQRSRSWSASCPGAPLPSLLIEPVALTPRESDVVGLARRGLANQQIAERLVVSVRTVESHLQHAYTKLGVSSRDQLTAFIPS